MDELTPVNVVHFFDTRSRTIACGATGQDRRSTKHPRQVTCQACVALIGERAGIESTGYAESPGASP